MVELVIADDHRVFAEALRSVLPERGFEVAGVAADAAEAVRLAQRCQPDICLLARCLVADSETIGDIRRAARRSRVVVLSPDTDTRSMRAVLARGAHGYVSKMCGLEVLLTALSGVMDGEVVVELADNGSPPSERGDDVLRLAEQLTARERQCLSLLVEGEHTTSMAKQLGVAETTVRTHVQSILTKLGVHSRLQAASLAMRYDLLRDTRADTAGAR